MIHSPISARAYRNLAQKARFMGFQGLGDSKNPGAPKSAGLTRGTIAKQLVQYGRVLQGLGATNISTLTPAMMLDPLTEVPGTGQTVADLQATGLSNSDIVALWQQWLSQGGSSSPSSQTSWWTQPVATGSSIQNWQLIAGSAGVLLVALLGGRR